jgi:hypothetical protein
VDSFGFGSIFHAPGPLGNEVTFMAPDDGAVEAGVFLDLLATREIVARFKVPDGADGQRTAK